MSNRANEVEKSIWSHYTDYLVEATHRSKSGLQETLDNMKTAVENGAEFAELKAMMLAVFKPVSIMQALEQWQNQMDILLHTGVKKHHGRSRFSFFKNKDKSCYTDFEFDSIVDDPDPKAHIYDLSVTTQTVFHSISEMMIADAPVIFENAMKSACLEENFELQMLLGDIYKKCMQFDKSIQVYKELWEKNEHRDQSIQHAIKFTEMLRSFESRNRI